MASMLSYGSQGEEVKRLQQLLNGAGAGLAVDGIFGDKTQEAVKKYQSKNGLGVDGIVGTQTWGALKGSGTSAQQAADAAAQGTNPDASADAAANAGAGVTAAQMAAGAGVNSNGTTVLPGQFNYGSGAPQWTESQAYQTALAALKQQEAAKPGEYVSPYGDRINELYEKYVNRGDFSYDFNADPLYQQYKDQYLRGGRMAMEDTMAQAAALSGGYGNSYAQAAGQQAYNNYLTQLNDIVPTLEQRAYDRYRDAGDDILSRLQVTQGLDDTLYGRHQDSLADYYNMLNYLYNSAGDQWNRDFDVYGAALNQYNADRTMAYNAYQAAQEQANWEREFALKEAAASGGSRSSKSGGSDNAAKSKFDINDYVRAAEALVSGQGSSGKKYMPGEATEMLVRSNPEHEFTPDEVVEIGIAAQKKAEKQSATSNR